MFSAFADKLFSALIAVEVEAGGRSCRLARPDVDADEVGTPAEVEVEAGGCSCRLARPDVDADEAAEAVKADGRSACLVAVEVIGKFERLITGSSSDSSDHV